MIRRWMRCLALLTWCVTAALPARGADDSVIVTLLEAKRSIVEVRAFRSDVRRVPGTRQGAGKIINVQGLRTVVMERSGAGVIIHPSGLIVTNVHTIAQATRLGVRLPTGDQLGAQVVELLPEYDLALLKVDTDIPLVPIPIGDSDSIGLSDRVITIGNSYLLKQTISEGKVSGIGTSASGRAAGDEDTNVFEIHMDIYRGDSGGPVLNRRGELIGMMTAKLQSRGKKSFAIASNRIKELYLKYVQ